MLCVSARVFLYHVQEGHGSVLSVTYGECRVNVARLESGGDLPRGTDRSPGEHYVRHRSVSSGLLAAADIDLTRFQDLESQELAVIM